MEYTRTNRHYRTAKRAARRNAERLDKSELNGTFIPDCEKKKVFALAGCVVALSFVLGFMLGYVTDLED
jgi:hypothetical protein